MTPITIIILFLLQEWNAVNASKKSGAGAADVFKPTYEFYEDLTSLTPTLLVRDGTDSLSAASSSS